MPLVTTAAPTTGSYIISVPHRLVRRRVKPDYRREILFIYFLVLLIVIITAHPFFCLTNIGPACNTYLDGSYNVTHPGVTNVMERRRLLKIVRNSNFFM
jgi:hypothetical protein